MPIHTNGTELKLWVANSGKPIPPATMERLFQPFFRGEAQPSQNGLGLGLVCTSPPPRRMGAQLKSLRRPKRPASRFGCL
jgi:C4-dicarboxylate-specific signal transduction histidine kinase